MALPFPAGTQILGTYGYETAGGITTTILTDALNKKSITVTDAEGKETSVKDLAPDDTSITTRYEYDGEGQKIKETYEDGSCSAFTYDASRQLIRQETFLADGTKEKVTRYEYDQATDLLLAMKDYRVENGEDQPVRYTGYAYDSFGRTTGYTEVDGTDRPSETQKAAGTVSYAYNEEDELTV